MAKTNKTFVFGITSTPKQLFDCLKAKASQHRAAFCGDESSGTFGVTTAAGDIQGEYMTADRKISIRITKAPKIAAWGQVESGLKTLLDACDTRPR